MSEIRQCLRSLSGARFVVTTRRRVHSVRRPRLVTHAIAIVCVAVFSAKSHSAHAGVDVWTNNGPEAGLATAAIAQEAYLKASNTGANDQFGISVAVSGDTVVIGAPQEGSNATGVNGDETNNSAPFSGAAYVFVRNGATWTQQAYLKASNAGAGDSFGVTVSVSGDTLVVGAVGEASNAIGVNGNQADNSALAAGAAYVFVRNGTTWTQQAYLKASNTAQLYTFGNSVSLSGDTVVIGSLHEASNATGIDGNQGNTSAPDAGAAYVFVRSGTTWTQQAYLKASNTGAGDLFGRPVRMSGDTIVVGAWYESSGATGVNGNQSDNSASRAGAAYVFVRNGTTWTQQAYLKASNAEANDQFGSSAEVSGDTVVIGAYGEASNAVGVNGNESDNSAASAGAAYVFVRSGTTWSQQAYLKASNTEANDQFGLVALSGDGLVVGALQEASNATGVNGDQNNNSASNSGAAYVFVRSGTTWTQQAYLKASNAEAGDNFQKCEISGDTLVVGAFKEDSNAIGVNGDQTNNSAMDAGAAYIFTGIGVVPTLVPTSTSTDTPTQTRTQTPSLTSTSSPTDTPTGTFTGTSTASPTTTPTPTSAATATVTSTATPTSTATSTGTVTPTQTQTLTQTGTLTPTSTSTDTSTATPAGMLTQTPPNTLTASPMASPTSTTEATPTVTSTVTAASIATSTNTVTSTGTRTQTATPTSTSAPSDTPTGALTQTPTDEPTAPTTATLTATTEATPTDTPTAAPSETASATPSPSPLPTTSPLCVGDCNGDHSVTVDEILAMVNIALGNANVAACRNGDANDDDRITVDEILTAVNNALNGCRSAPLRQLAQA